MTNALGFEAAAPPVFSLFVPGIPKPSGSKNAVPVWSRSKGGFAHSASGRPIVAVMDSSKGSKDWKAAIRAMAALEWGERAPLDQPVAFDLAFFMPRPKFHWRTGRNAAFLKPDAPSWHTSKPDLTKLIRAAEDAISGVVIRDDTLVVRQAAVKEYGLKPGVRIVIRTI